MMCTCAKGERIATCIESAAIRVTISNGLSLTADPHLQLYTADMLGVVGGEGSVVL